MHVWYDAKLYYLVRCDCSLHWSTQCTGPQLAGCALVCRLKADSKCLCLADAMRRKSLSRVYSLFLYTESVKQLFMPDLIADIPLNACCAFENVGEWVLARSAACLVCCRGSYQPGQQCSLRRDCSALPGGSHILYVQTTHTTGSCHSKLPSHADSVFINTSVMTTDVTACHAA